MRFILPLALLACAPEMLEVDTHPDSMQAFLVDAPLVDFAERARTAGTIRGRLMPDGPELYGDIWSDTGTYAVADAFDDVGLIWSSHRAQLVVWVPRRGLETVPVGDTWTHEEGGVRLPAGLAVEIAEEEGGAARILVENDALEVDLWMDARDLDQVWIDESSESWEPEPGEVMWSYADVALLDAPLGQPIGILRAGTGSGEGDRGQQVVTLEKRRGHTRVQLDADGWPVDAWLHDDDLYDGPQEWGMFGRGSFGFGCGMASLGEPTVRENAPLYSEPGGPVVGRALQTATFTLEGSPGDWRGIEVRTPWGIAPLWVAPEDVLASETR